MKKLLIGLTFVPVAFINAQEQQPLNYVPTLYTLALNATTKKFIGDIQDLSLQERFALVNKLNNKTHCMGSDRSDSSNETVLKQFEHIMGASISQPVNFDGSVLDVSSDGNYVLTKKSNQLELGQIVLKKIKDSEHYEQKLIPIQRYYGHDKVINAAQLIDNNTKILSGSNDASLRLWDVATGKTIHTLKEHTGWIYQLVVSKDQQHALSISKDKKLIWWNLNEGKAIHTLEGHTKSILHAELSADDTKAVSCGLDGTIKVWNLKDGQLINSLNNNEPVGFTELNTSGTKILSVSNNCLKIWNIESHNPDTIIKTNRENTHAMLTKDGSKVISVTGNEIILWNAITGKKIDALTPTTKEGLSEMRILSVKMLHPLLVRNNVSIDQLAQYFIKAIPSSLQGYIEPENIHETRIVKNDFFVFGRLFKLEKWQSILDSMPRPEIKNSTSKTPIFNIGMAPANSATNWAILPFAKK